MGDEDRDDKHVGRDSHDYVDDLQGQVEENALYLVIASVKHTEGFHCGVDVSGGVVRELSWGRGRVERQRCIYLHDFTTLTPRL